MAAPLSAVRSDVASTRPRRLLGRFGPNGASVTSRRLFSLVSGNAVAAVVTMATTPVLTRVYSREAFGIAATALALAGLVAATTFLTLEFAVPNARSWSRRGALVAQALAAATIAVPCWAGVAVVARRFNLAGVGELSRSEFVLTWMTALAIAGFTLCRSVSLASDRYRLLAGLAVGVATARATSQIGFGLVMSGAAGLIAGEAIARVLAAGVALRTAWSSLLVRPPQRSGQHRRYADFVYLGLPGTLMNQAATVVPLLALAHQYGTAVAGEFTLASRLLAVTPALLGSAVGEVLQRQLVELHDQTGEAASALMRRTALRTFSLAAGPYVVAMVLSPFVLPTIFGATWARAGYFVSFLALGALAELVISPLSRVAAVYDRGQRVRVYDAYWLACLIGLFIVSDALALRPTVTMLCYSVLNVSSYVLYYAMLQRLTRHGLREAAHGLEESAA